MLSDEKNVASTPPPGREEMEESSRVRHSTGRVWRRTVVNLRRGGSGDGESDDPFVGSVDAVMTAVNVDKVDTRGRKSQTCIILSDDPDIRMSSCGMHSSDLRKSA